MNIKRFLIECIEVEYKTTMVAKDKKDAWRKFITQKFGALKPNPNDYRISLIESVEV